MQGGVQPEDEWRAGRVRQKAGRVRRHQQGEYGDEIFPLNATIKRGAVPAGCHGAEEDEAARGEEKGL